jgi:hypothetical protein
MLESINSAIRPSFRSVLLLARYLDHGAVIADQEVVVGSVDTCPGCLTDGVDCEYAGTLVDDNDLQLRVVPGVIDDQPDAQAFLVPGVAAGVEIFMLSHVRGVALEHNAVLGVVEHEDQHLAGHVVAEQIGHRRLVGVSGIEVCVPGLGDRQRLHSNSFGKSSSTTVKLTHNYTTFLYLVNSAFLHRIELTTSSL